MLTCRLVVSTPRALTFWIVKSVMPMFCMSIFIAGSEFLCSRKTFTPFSLAWSVKLGDALDEATPDLRIRTLEGVVVALRAGPDDEVRPHSRAEVYAAPQGIYALAAESLVWVYERAQRVSRVGVETCGDHRQVHLVGGEDPQHLLGVVLIDLTRIVVLEPFQEVVESACDALRLLDHWLVQRPRCGSPAARSGSQQGRKPISPQSS